MITWGCNRQEGNLELKFLVLITGEIADSCGQRDSPDNMFACQWSPTYGKWICNCTDIREKALAKNWYRKVESKPMTSESSAATPIYSTSAAASSCLHAHVPSLCQRCFRCCHTLNRVGVSFARKMTQPIFFCLKASLAPRTIMQQEDICALTRLGPACHGTEAVRSMQRWKYLKLALTSTMSVFLL